MIIEYFTEEVARWIMIAVMLPWIVMALFWGRTWAYRKLSKEMNKIKLSYDSLTSLNKEMSKHDMVMVKAELSNTKYHLEEAEKELAFIKGNRNPLP